MTEAHPNGFALIGALWLLVVISIIGLEFGLEARDRRLLAINHVEEAQAREVAQACIQQVRSHLQALLSRDAPGRFDPWAEADSILVEPVEVGRATCQVDLEDPGARLQLNLATEDELRRLLEALHVDAGRADRIAQSIMDWRDPDDLRRARGAETVDYVSSGSTARPRNGPFASLAELEGVKDVSPAVLERLLPHLTLEGEGRVNLYAAEDPVLLALPGITAEVVATLARLKRQGRRLASVADLGAELSPRAQEAFHEALPTLLARTTLETRELTVTSVGLLESGHEVQIRSQFVRGGSHVFLVSSRIER